MGLSNRSDSAPVHARRVGQVHELAAVPGSPALAPTGDGPMMPKINSVLSIPSDSPSHVENRATRTISEEATAEGEMRASANADDERAELAVQRTALEGILAKYGLRLEPSNLGDAPAEARDSSPHLDSSRALRAKLLASEGSRTVEMSPPESSREHRLGSCELSPSDWNSALAEARAESYPAPMSPILRSLSERDMYRHASPSDEALAREPSPGARRCSQVKSGFVRVVGGFS